MIHKFFVFIFIATCALAESAQLNLANFTTPTQFIPTPINADKPLRFYVGFDTSSIFHGYNSKMNWTTFQLNAALIYKVWKGLDIGIGAHGFANSSIGLTVEGSGKDGFIAGSDLMIRYVEMMNNYFYAGIQYQVGYSYTDRFFGFSESQLKNLGLDKTKANSYIPMSIAAPLGVVFKDVATLYVAPALEMGQTPKSSLESSLWKSALGFNVAVGAAFDLGSTKLVLQVKPRMTDFDNANSWGMDAGLGAYWNF